VAAKSFGEVDLALKKQYSSWLPLAEFYQCSSWFLGILRCYDLFRDIGSKSMDLLGYGL
jgi:hypothetical protein